MHFSKIEDMLWISQVFERFNFADMLEILGLQKTCAT
jgi:hypothetical protein